jgi:hypothetical protein
MIADKFTSQYSIIRLWPQYAPLTCCRRPLAMERQRLSCNGMRLMATSAEKRKWRRLSKYEVDPIQLEASKKKYPSSPTSGSNAHPFFFLVVFPVLLTSLVVLTREDLREELDQKGLVKLIKDWRRDTSKKHEDGSQSSN